jgi:hypothetical protein
MAAPLRPLSARELLGETFSLYRYHSILFVGLSFAGPAITFAYRMIHVSGASAAKHSDLRSASVSLTIDIATGVAIMLLAGLALSSATIIKAVEATYEGREIRARNVYRALKNHIWRVIGVILSVLARAFLSSLLFIGLGMFALGLAAFLGYNSRVEAGTIGVVCGTISVIAAIFAAMRTYVRYAVAVHACVMEEVSPRLALERSAFLTHGDHFRVTMVYAVFAMSSFVTCSLLEASTLLVRGHGVAFQLSDGIFSLIALALTAPIGTVGMSLLYYDERVRKEALAQLRTEQPTLNHQPPSRLLRGRTDTGR